MSVDFAARSGIVTVVDVDADAASRLTSRAADVVQIVREALSNVGRHGAASTPGEGTTVRATFPS